MTARTDGERLAVLEAGMTSISTDIRQLRTEVATLTKTIDSLVQAKLTDHVKLDNEIEGVKNEINEIKSQNRPFNRWITHTLSAIVGAILLFLITHFLNTV